MSYKILVVAMLMICPQVTIGQSYEKEYKRYFAWEVKQLDEFIERFNNDEFTFIKGYLKKNESSPPITREIMIKKLFNAKGTNWNREQITLFIKQVNDAENPQFLNFDKDNWFANVHCKILYHNKVNNAIFKLRIENLPDGSSKWVIADIQYPDGNVTTISSKEETTSSELPVPTDPDISLNPMSHAIDFMNIDLVTKNPDNIGNFIDKSSRRSNNMNVFIDACLKKQFKIVSATSITYDFLQIKGWLIEVRQFNRQSINSGWLISKLIKRS